MADVVLYSRPGCMFCAQVGTMLRGAGIPFRIIDVPARAEQNALIERWGALSFPLVLVEGEYVGGFTHVLRLHSQGRLRGIVSDVVAEDQPRPPLPAVRPRLSSSVDSTPKTPVPASPVPAAPDPGQAAGSLADYAKLGEYLQRWKKKL